jgi:hypothetical protein
VLQAGLRGLLSFIGFYNLVPWRFELDSNNLLLAQEPAVPLTSEDESIASASTKTG